MKKVIYALLFLTFGFISFTKSERAISIDKSLVKDDLEGFNLYPSKRDTVEKSAEYKGGMQALSKFVKKNLKYPQQAQDFNIQGSVYIRFVVEKNGELTNIECIKDIGGGCGDEGIKLVQKMKRWKPGKINGQSVRQRITLPLKFQLHDKKFH